jgi:hypothetical protein
MMADVTSGDVKFGGPAARVAAGGVDPQLYSPPQWDPGSSISHLSEYYADADTDAMLSAFAFAGWAFHDPGPITLAVLKDIGWTISGLGTPVQVTFTNQERRIVAADSPLPIPVEVVAQDPIGVRVNPVGPAEVTLEAWGRFAPSAQWSCPGGFSRPLTGGVAVFDGCIASGPWEAMFLRATSPDLAYGLMHVFRVVEDAHITFVPGLTSTR